MIETSNEHQWKHVLANRLLCDLLQAAREHISCFFQLSTDVAELDVISSLAQASALNAYVRPTFGTKLELLDSRHPVLEVLGLDDPVPNNVVRPSFPLFSFLLCFSFYHLPIAECLDTLEFSHHLWAQHEWEINLFETNRFITYNGANRLLRASQTSSVSYNGSNILQNSHSRRNWMQCFNVCSRS